MGSRESCVPEGGGNRRGGFLHLRMEGVGSSVPGVLGEEMTGVPDFSRRGGAGAGALGSCGEQRVLISGLCLLGGGSALRLRRLGPGKAPSFLSAAARFRLESRRF